MKLSILSLFEQLAAYGTAPPEGCTLFGVGYEDVFERLSRTYLGRRFRNGLSAEKFVIGPFGSGKTHFLRQLMELAREQGCVTSEVQLNKQIDFTKSLIVYKEVANEIRTPEGTRRGMENLIACAVERLSSKAVEPGQGDVLVRAWVAGLEEADFESPAFARIARVAFEAFLADDDLRFRSACRWLSGDVADRPLARELGVSPLPSAEHALYGRRALMSLFQLIRRAGFAGTVVGMDEAEQGMAVDKRRVDKILSMLQSELNAMNDLRDGAALVVYAFTPDLIERFYEYAALQARVADPGPNLGFFDNPPNDLAPTIDLSRRSSLESLRRMGERLTEVFYEGVEEDLRVPRERALDFVRAVAEEVRAEDASSSSRRMMAKRSGALLLHIYNHGGPPPDYEDPGPPEDEV